MKDMHDTKRNTKKGFTLLELLAVLVILAALATIAIPIFTNNGGRAREIAHNETVALLQKQAQAYLWEQGDTGVQADIIDTMVTTGYLRERPTNPIASGDGSGAFTVAVAADGKVTVSPGLVEVTNTAQGGGTPPASDPEYNVAMGVNKPKLLTGMTPIKWDGSNNVVTTTADDVAWYNYAGDVENGSYATSEKWANVQLGDVDNSMFVWIPRYAYKITGDNTDSAADDKIEIEYLEGTSTTSTAGFTVHPAFTYGATQLTGIWVAKFEASQNASTNIKVVPSVASWRSITVNNIYNKCIAMKTGSYGLNSSEVDTLMMRNRDWGAVTYLSEAVRDGVEIWINNDSGYVTGSAGSSASAGTDVGTISDYKNAQCQKASTTGNVYGIYDMSGGAWEYIASYVANGNGILTTNGGSLVTAYGSNSGVADVLAVTEDGTPTYQENYTQTEGNTTGLALHEIMKCGDNSTNTNTFKGYGDYQYFPYSANPFFLRGGNYSNGTSAGAFAGHYINGTADSNVSFRPVLCGLD
ncbi:MAG TPA: hypothetical protein DCP90_06185 [Clostridiales bacterium]|nr:hypothetical protein [Clostridiales bacterium]